MHQKIDKVKRKITCIWLSWLILAVILFPSKIRSSDSYHVVISPISVIGPISVSEQKMLFNRFREQINQHYSLISYQVLEMIAEQEESIDIENCISSNCVSKLKNFVNRIRWQFKTDDLFLFGVIKSEKETQLTLKLSSLSAPEVTQKIVTRTCQDCRISALMDEVDKLVKRMMQKIIENKFIHPDEKVASPEDNFPKTIKEKPDEKVASPEDMIPQVTKEKTDLTPEPPPPDPYNLARDSYNQ